MARSVVKRRLYVVNVPPSVPLDKVYQRLAEAVRSGYAEITVRGGKAYIEIVGTDAQIKESWLKIREALSQLWSLHYLRTANEAPIEAIVREAGRTFPPEALLYALRLRGYKAELSSDKQVIYTNAPPEEVVGLARSIAEVLDELRFRVRGSAAKRLIAALAAGLGVDPEAVIETGLRARVFEEAEDGIRLREEWRRGLRKLALVLRPEALEHLGEGEGRGEAKAPQEDRE
jgi:hypothetical protein